MITNLNLPNNSNSIYNAFNLPVKNIGGKLYRINNNLNFKGVKGVIENNNEIDVKQNIREFKLLDNLKKKISEVLSEDDAISDDDYSGNTSFLDEEEDVNNKNNLKMDKYLEDEDDLSEP